jgi:hypothetical protein
MVTQSSLCTATVLLEFWGIGERWMSHIHTEDDRVCSSPGTAAYCKQSRKFFDNCESAGLRFHRETSQPWPGAVPWPAHTEERCV